MSRAAATTGNFSHIKEGNQSFLIMEQPKEQTLHSYYPNFTDYNVKHVVRVCPEVTYDPKDLESKGINCHAFPYADGSPPPKEVIEPWLELCSGLMRENKQNAKNGAEPATIAIHCIAGLGRAPVLVAIALITEGMDCLKSVETIREVRKGALNKPQVEFLKVYEKNMKKTTCACM